MIINVELRENSYNIVIERGALNKFNELISTDRKVLIVTDSGVPAQYAESVARNVKDGHIVTIPQGESSKSIDNLQFLCKKMLELGFTRKDCVVAVGGGVVGDLAGFAASVYMRGIDFYNVPTTVLSQVDSSVGGKVAVNFEGVKNILGAFYQPKMVIIDPDVLDTLDKRQISNGLAEAVKMGLTSDLELFELFEKDDPYQFIDEIIARSISIKKHIVELDEKESNLRKVLNFGHTVGHGFESEQIGSLLHGECVALGMLFMCSDRVKERLIPVLQTLQLPTHIDFDSSKVLSAIAHDKKSTNSGISVVFVPKIGEYLLKEMSLQEIEQLIGE